MTDIKRDIENELEAWRISNNRKPLILRGARQVGKTTTVVKFGKQYKHFISLNLENQENKDLFDRARNIKEVVTNLLLTHNIKTPELPSTLLFIDEIQESPKAIHLLRYFYEEYPKLHVIAAGSLLEHALVKVSNFPVGRIQYLYMYPLNFLEYLGGRKLTLLQEELNTIPCSEVANKLLIKEFNSFTIIGGMPAIVKNFIKNEDLTMLDIEYESIWEAYKDDAEKYARNATQKKVLRHIMNTAPHELEAMVKLQNFGGSNYKSREVKEAFEELEKAKIIQLIYPSTDYIPPAQPNLRKHPRLQILDTGIINYETNLQKDLLTMEDISTAYKGKIVPHMIAQELQSLGAIKSLKPKFWIRDKKSSSAEIDLIYTFNQKVIPIEIKSGATGTLKSLQHFIDNCDHIYAVRMYSGKFSIENHTTQAGKNFKLMNLPYCMGVVLPEYLEYFLKNN